MSSISRISPPLSFTGTGVDFHPREGVPIFKEHGFQIERGSSLASQKQGIIAQKRKRSVSPSLSTPEETVDSRVSMVATKKVRRGDLSVPTRSPLQEEIEAENPIHPEFEDLGKTPLSKNLSEELSTEETSLIVGREREVQRLIDQLSFPIASLRPLLNGEKGLGKETIVKKLCHKILEGSVPESLKGRSIIEIDCSVFAGQSSATTAPAQKLQRILNGFLKKHEHPILFFRDIEKLFQFDGVKDYLEGFFRSPVSCIASSAESDSSELGSTAFPFLLSNNFILQKVDNLSLDEVTELAQKRLAYTGLPGDLSLDKSTLNFAASSVSTFLKSRPLHVRLLNIVYEVASRLIRSGSASSLIEKQDVAEVLSDYTRIPAEHILKTNSKDIETIRSNLKEQVIGQDHVIDGVCEAVQRYKTGFRDTSKPWGVFLFAGTTGTGKTALAKALTQELFHDQSSLIRIDMSEFVEDHSVSRLIGAPPGYLGHESGGQLVKALSEKPHSIVLLDEIEKAHPIVLKTFLQVFEDGRLTDGRGVTVDCSQAAFIMTSNLGSHELSELPEVDKQHPSILKDCLEPIVREHLSPELYNRLTALLPFKPLQEGDIPRVIEAHLSLLKRRFFTSHQLTISWKRPLVEHLSALPFDETLGMRALCRQVEILVGNYLSEEAMAGRIERGSSINLSIRKGKISS